MFSEIKLITKRDNKIQELTSDWDSNSKIYCACSLEIGFGDKITWSEGNAIRFSSLIEFYKKLADSVTNPNDEFYEYEFLQDQSSFLIEWTRIHSTTFKVTLKKKYFDSVTTLIDKYFWAGNLHGYRDTFFMNIMSILTQKTNENVCIAVGEMFFEKQEQINYELKIGQKVRTRIGRNVKTIREGYIINRFYHDKEKTTMYQILENEKKLEKRYYASDFESNKNSTQHAI
jgi:hypothetical protein